MPKRKFAVIGHPIGHTMSPFIHKRLFELAKKDGEYIKVDISPEELKLRMNELNELCGYNITIPHKQAIIPFQDKLDKKAELYGSVNTVKNGAVKEGFTTDPDGFLKALETGGINFGGNVVILGSGGVARTFVYEAALAGCNITLAARNINTADKLTEEVQEKVSGAVIKTCLITELDELDIMPDLLINATSIGFSDVSRELKPFGGVMIPAHVDKTTTSIISNLGFIPPDSDFKTFECKNMANLHQ